MPDDAVILRAIGPKHLKDDGTIKAGFFKDKTGVSVNLEVLSSSEETLAARPGFKLVRFTAGDVRRLVPDPQTKPPSNDPPNVEHDPVIYEGVPNYGHGLLVPRTDPAPDDRRISTAYERALIKVVTIIE